MWNPSLLPRQALSIVLLVVVFPPALSARQAKGQKEPTALDQLSASFQQISRQVGPAVVQILTAGYAPVPGKGVITTQRGSGSGVIVDPEGYILTNAHVVTGAERIQVQLALPSAREVEWRSILKPQGKILSATIVGMDFETDLAVLKVEQTGLSTLEFSDSDRLKQGEVVLAFGSPLGLEKSVSMGIVSSTARQLRQDDSMIYIQTDAPINPGNSGGPLVNTEGRLVGINTFILSQSGGSEGLGFAAPSNIVRTVFAQIRKSGRVRRGHIGALSQTVTPTLAAGLRLPRSWGVILADVVPRGPADVAGLRIGDLVLKLDGKEMENARQFDVNLYQKSVGESVTLELLRGSEQLTRNVSVTERPNDPSRFAGMASRESNLIPRLGIFALDLDEQIAALMPPLRKPAGVVVAARVAGGSETAEDLSPGDLISAVNGETVRDLAGLKVIVEKLKRGDAVVIQAQRLGQLMYIAFEIN